MSVVKSNVMPIREGALDAPACAGEGATLEQQLADTSRLLESASRQLEQQQRQFEEMIQQLQQQADHDALTSLYNRRKFNTLCGNEILRARRYQTPMALIMLDIDRFKCVNDSFGHLAGDQVLVELSNVVGARMRESDTLARWGGEEFMVLAPHTELAQALILAEQIRGVIEQTRFSSVGRVTCSFGVTEHCEHDTVERLIDRADAALYHAKHGGRNRVEAFAAHLARQDRGRA